MRVSSVDNSYETSLLLHRVVELVLSQAPGAVLSREAVPGGQKSELLVSITLSVGTGLTANLLYDLVKVASRNLGDKIRGHKQLRVDDREVHLDDLELEMFLDAGQSDDAL